RLAHVTGVRPRFAEERDLLGLQLVERNLRVFEEERRAHQVHALLSRPDCGLARPGAPPDAIGEAGRLRLHRQERVARAAADVRVDDAGTRDRGTEKRGLLAGLGLVDAVAERLRAAPRRLGRAAAHAELQPATCQQV